MEGVQDFFNSPTLEKFKNIPSSQRKSLLTEYLKVRGVSKKLLCSYNIHLKSLFSWIMFWQDDLYETSKVAKYFVSVSVDTIFVKLFIIPDAELYAGFDSVLFIIYRRTDVEMTSTITTFCFFVQQDIYSIMAWFCTVIDHRERQDVVRTSTYQCYHILMPSENGINFFNGLMYPILQFDTHLLPSALNIDTYGLRMP